MALVLTRAIKVGEQLVAVTGESLADAPVRGSWLLVEEEVMAVVAAGLVGLADPYDPGSAPTWQVTALRGADGTAEAAHDASTPVTPVSAVNASFPVAENVAAIADPSGDAETTVNAILDALKGAGLMEEDEE